MKKRKFPWLLIHAAVIFVILLVAFSPLISVAIAGSIADANGCVLHEGYVNPCIVNGQDMGETLYAMGVMGWLMLATIPLGLIAVVAYLLIVLVVWLIRRSSRKETAAVQEA